MWLPCLDNDQQPAKMNAIAAQALHEFHNNKKKAKVVSRNSPKIIKKKIPFKQQKFAYVINGTMRQQQRKSPAAAAATPTAEIKRGPLGKKINNE